MDFNSLAIRPRQVIAVLGLTALGLFATGCATSSPPEATETQATADLVKEMPADAPEVGIQVGNQVPEFSLGLVDGVTLTSTELLNDSQPTFLFFFDPA